MTDPTTRPTSVVAPNRRALVRHRAALVAFIAANLALLALLPDTRAILGGEDAGTTFVFVAVSAVWFAAFMITAITNDHLTATQRTPQPPAVPAPITLEQWRATRPPAPSTKWSWERHPMSELEQGDRVRVTMRDSGHVSTERVGPGGTYLSRLDVERGLATVKIASRFANTVWGQVFEYVDGLLHRKSEGVTR